MTARQIASRLDGRPYGGGWMARCPCRAHAHGDRNRSLSIRERGGWVKLHCFALCSEDEILAALGLRVRDLAMREYDPKAAAEMNRVRQKAKEETANLNRQYRHIVGQAEFWRDRRDELGKELYEHPESDKIAVLFHRACTKASTLSDAAMDALGKLFLMINRTKPLKAFNCTRICDMDGGGELPEVTLEEVVFWSHYRLLTVEQWRERMKTWTPSEGPKMDPDAVMQRSVRIANLIRSTLPACESP